MKGLVRLKKIVSASCILLCASHVLMGINEQHIVGPAAATDNGVFISVEDFPLFFELMGIFARFEGMGEEAIKPLFVTCSKCCKGELEVSCFTGWLSGIRAVDELHELRMLLNTSNTETVKAFMAATANAKQIECTTCLGFHSWQ